MGNVLVEEWHVWLFLTSAAGIQVLILLLCPFRHRVLIFYVLFIAFIFAPVYWDRHSIGKQAPSIFERTFFFFAAHQFLFWILTVLAVLLAQLSCERRFSQMEQ